MSAEFLQTMVDKFILRVKVGYLYTESGAWVAMDAGTGIARVGLSDFRQMSGGDAAFVELPAVGARLAAGQDMAHIETVKADIVLPAPLDGVVVAVNEALGEQAELVNQSPYADGWLLDMKPAQWPAAGLLDAPAYLALMTEQARKEVAK